MFTVVLFTIVPNQIPTKYLPMDGQIKVDHSCNVLPDSDANETPITESLQKQPDIVILSTNVSKINLNSCCQESGFLG